MRLEIRMDLNAIVARIEERLTELELTAERASLNSGLSRDGIRNLRRAARSGIVDGGAQARTLSMLTIGLKTNLRWLMDGIGDRNQSDSAAELEEFRAIYPELPRIDQEYLISLARRLRDGAPKGDEQDRE